MRLFHPAHMAQADDSIGQAFLACGQHHIVLRKGMGEHGFGGDPFRSIGCGDRGRAMSRGSEQAQAKVSHSMDAIVEGTSSQSRQLPGVTISKRNGNAIRSEILQTAKRISCETRLGLFAVRYDGRSRCFQAADRIA